MLARCLMPRTAMVLALALLAAPCRAAGGDLPRERTMFGPLVCGQSVLAGIQDRSEADGKCHVQLSAVDLHDGRWLWQHEYVSSDMSVELQTGPEGTVLLPAYQGGALMLSLTDGRTVRRLTPTPASAWRVIAANKKSLFTDGATAAQGSGTRPTVSGCDAGTLRRLWVYRFAQPKWIVGGMQADDRLLEVRVLEPYPTPAATTGPACPAAAKLVGYFTFEAGSGRFLGQDANPKLSWGPRMDMKLPDGKTLIYGGGNASRTAFYEEAREQMGRRVVWRLAYEGLHDSVLVPPLMLVAYGQFDYSDTMPGQKITHTRTLLCLDAATGKTTWVAALEPGEPTPPQVLPATEAPPRLQTDRQPPPAGAQRGGSDRAAGTPVTPGSAGRSAFAFVVGGLLLVLVLLVALRLYRGAVSRPH